MRQIAMLVAPLVVACGCRSPGFSIEAAASGARLGALAGFTFDSRGRPVVFKERGFATLLADNNGDGIFETEKVLTTQVSAIRGIWLDGRMLYLLGNGPAGRYGLYRLEDRNRDDEMDDLEQLSQFEAPAPGTHDMRRGPDGALTLLQGGKWLRWNEDRRSFTALASGFANPRAHAYNRDGEAFVLDDGVRTVHAVVGGDYGAPAYHFDVLPPMREAATSGIEFYQHHVYPEAFRDALFQAEGQHGRIVARRVIRSGATYRLDDSVLAEFVTGEQFTVTDLKVGPDGFVYFTTSHPGGLYRIRYERGWPAPSNEVAMVRQPQPLSAWGHAALQRQRELQEARWGEDLEVLARKAGAPAVDRVQAILLLQRFGPKPNAALLKALLADAEPRVRAAAVYVGGNGLTDRDPLVRRRAAEALDGEFEPGVYLLLGDSDRFVRYAARLALERMPREDWRARVLDERDSRIALEGMLALVHTGSGDHTEVLSKLLPMLDNPNALRLFTLASAGVKDAALRKRAAEILLPQFDIAGRDEVLSRELASALAWCGGTEVIQKILDAMGKASANRPLQMHYAECLRSIKDGWTAEQKQSMLAWFQAASASPAGSLNQLFDSFVNGVLTKEEGRRARQRLPKLGGAAGGGLSAQEIFDIQMSSAATAATPGKGRAIFEKQCSSCHRFMGLGGDAGPDLTEVAKRLEKPELLEAILWPSREVPERYRSVVLELADGSAIEGLVVREDNKVLLLKTANEPRPISILKSRVISSQSSEKSIMPEGLLDGDDQRAVAGLVAFLRGGKD